MADGPRPASLSRVPPHNLRAEESVLGAMMLSREAIADVVEILDADHFYKPAHAHLYDAVMTLYSAGEPVDAVTVAEELQRAGMLEEIGGHAVLLDFQATTPAISNAAHYARIVEDHALLRRLITVSNEIAEMAYSVPEDVVKAVDDAEARMFDVAQRRVTNTTAALRDLLPANLDRIEMLYDRGESITGLSTGYLDLDEKLAGLQPNSLYVVGARPAMGKALALDTPLATPSGWTTMAEVEVGDQLFDEQGRPTSVTYKSPIFRGHDCYEVVFDDGSVIVADADHQWLTWDQRAARPTTRTTSEMAATLLVGADGRSNHRIPLAGPLDCPEQDLPLDPYLLGMWLGGGRADEARVTTTDEEIIAALDRRRIPPPYRRASIKQRLGLLQGLLDAVGNVVEGQFTCRLPLSDEALLADARELALSLGYPAGPVTRERSEVGTEGWRFDVSDLDPVFRPEWRSAGEWPTDGPDGGSHWRGIIDVRPTISRPVQCVTVDSPSHLYLAGRELIPTHNTAFSLGMAANSAMKDRRPVLIFTLEMGQLELSQRLLCSEALVDSGKVKTGRLEEAEWNRISHAVGRLAEAPIFIDDNPHTSVMDIRAKARRLKSREGDLGMVVVDYIQLMTGRSSAESRQVEVSEISRNLKILARELEAPVVALAQLNRGLEQRNDKRPMLSDLRESGCMPASTRILLADGSERTMGDLLDTGDTPDVVGVDDRGRLVTRRLVKTFTSGTRPVHRMTLATGRQVDATANHRFLTVEGWKSLGDLAAGQYVAVPRVFPEPSAPVRWPMPELVMLAHLLGDGSTVAAVKYASTDQANIDAVTDAARHWGCSAKVETRSREQTGAFQLWIPAPYRLTHNRRHPIARWLSSLDLWGKRSYQKFIPSDVFRMSTSDVALFLHHLWATDGSLTINKGRTGPSVRCYYSTSSRRLAADVQRLLLRFGIRARVGTVRKDGYRDNYHVEIQGALAQLAFLRSVGCHGERGKVVEEAVGILSDVRLNPNVDLVPGVIREKVKAAMTARGMSHRQLAAALGEEYCGSYLLGSVTRDRRFSRERLGRIGAAVEDRAVIDVATSDIFWDEIVAIQPLGEQPVLDCTVDDVHNFIANGIVAHNSLEQDADVVLFLYRDEVYDDNSPDKGVAEVIVAKHRNGPTGRVRLAFRGQYTRFDNMAHSGNQGGGGGGGAGEF